MKQHIKLLAALFAVGFTFTGCYDLDRYPADQLSEGTFFKNQSHADAAMVGVYNTMQYDNVFGLQFSLDCLGGISNGYDPQGFDAMQKGTYDVTNGQVLSRWGYLYEGIARTNLVLQKLGGTEMSEDLMARYKGEAKFMRALFYFQLLDFFGGVPIYDESVVVADNYSKMLNPRNTAEEVRAFVLKDLKEAENSLPETWDKANAGRATKYAAIALQGKVYLWNKQYKEAAERFRAVVNSGKYALYPNYADLFKPAGDSSNEMIFAVQNIGGVGTDFGMPMSKYLGSREAYGSGWNNVMVSTNFADSYEYKDGRPFNWNNEFPGFNENDNVKVATFRAGVKDGKTVTSYPAAKEKLLQIWENRDPRMAASLILPYTHFTGWYANKVEECEFVVATGIVSGNGLIRNNANRETYFWRKFVPEGNMGGAINNALDTPINFPLIRYADVLLMLAECENELGNLDAAVGLVNQVRARVNMPGLNSGPEWLKVSSKKDMFNRIRHERAVELACEGHSFSDLKRWGLLETLNGVAEKDMTGGKWYTRVVRSRDYLWPIPSSEIEKNPNLKQNPGW